MCFITWTLIGSLRYTLPVGNTKTPPMRNYFSYFVTEDEVSGGIKKRGEILYKIFIGS